VASAPPIILSRTQGCEPEQYTPMFDSGKELNGACGKEYDRKSAYDDEEGAPEPLLTVNEKAIFGQQERSRTNSSLPLSLNVI
jgi:hypothetical protein